MIKKLASLLLLALALATALNADEATDKNNSASIDLSASRHYSAADAQLDLGFNRFLNSLSITLSDQKSGDAASTTTVAAWQGALLAGFAFKKVVSGDFGVNAGGDNEKRGSLGAKVDGEADFELSSWLSLAVLLGTSYTRLSAPQDSEVTGDDGRTTKLKDSTAVTQIYPNSGLNFSFFEDAAIISIAAGNYRYQNYTSGLAGTAQREDSLPSDASDTLVSGFYSKDWSVGLDIKLFKGLRASATYTQTLPYESGLWIKNLEVELKSKIGSRWSAQAGVGRDVANGSGSATLKAGATLSF